MAQLQKVASAASAVEMTPGIDLVMESPLGQGVTIALVRQPDTGRYAACRMDFKRLVVRAPVRHTGTEGAHLAAVMTGDGLRKVLNWTDRQAAMSDFAAMSSGAEDPR